MNTYYQIALAECRKHRWLMGALFLFLASLLMPSFDQRYNPVQGRLSDAFHYPLCFMLGLFCWGYTRKKAFSRQAAIFFVLIGGGLLTALAERLQPYFGRSCSLTDWVFGMFGFFLAVLIGWRWEEMGRDFSQPFRLSALRMFWGSSGFFIALSALSMAVIALFPVVRAWEIVTWQDESFPILARGEHPWEKHLWKPIAHEGSTEMHIAECPPKLSPKDYGVDARGEAPNTDSEIHTALRVMMRGKGWHGVGLRLPDRAWLAEQTLTIEVFAFHANQVITVRIDDCGDSTDYRHRFNKKFKLPEQGWNVIRVPVSDVISGENGKKLDLSCLLRLIIAEEIPIGESGFYLAKVALD